MRLFPAPPEIDEKNGFDQGDLFGRKEFGDRLTRLVLALEHPAVLLLDAPWGAGKTVFVKMWEGELRKRSVPVIHFDAFASDYMADPFTALAGEVLDLAKDNESDDAKVDAFRKKALGVVKVLARHGLRIGIRVATQGLVDIGDSTDAKADEKAIVDGVTDAADALLLKRLEDHAAERETFAAFREALKELADNLGSAKLDAGERRPPLVFVIDELDRCRPTFALSLLETVKHFFDVEGVVFLLVTNMAQLEKSVEFAYGAGIDARGYLEKFFHLRAFLPLVNVKNSPASIYIGHLLKPLPDWFKQNNIDNLVVHTNSIVVKHRLSLRNLEKVAAYLHLFTQSATQCKSILPKVIISLCCMKVAKPSDYDEISTSESGYSRLQDWGFGRSHAQDLDEYERYIINGENIGSNAQADKEKYRMSRERYISLWCSWIDGFELPDDI